MRLVIQRVKEARVRAYAGDPLAEQSGVQSAICGEIGNGLCVLVGITQGDGAAEVAKAARKICELKLLRGPAGDDSPKARQSVEEAGAEVLLVSQFTLYADVRKGRNPSWSKAAPGDYALPVFQELVAEIRRRGVAVATGEFGAMMDVELINDGPFTILFEA